VAHEIMGVTVLTRYCFFLGKTNGTYYFLIQQKKDVIPEFRPVLCLALNEWSSQREGFQSGDSILALFLTSGLSLSVMGSENEVLALNKQTNEEAIMGIIQLLRDAEGGKAPFNPKGSAYAKDSDRITVIRVETLIGSDRFEYRDFEADVDISEMHRDLATTGVLVQGSIDRYDYATCGPLTNETC
jgi:hypothetical protein